jgi:hypothetical protein
VVKAITKLTKTETKKETMKETTEKRAIAHARYVRNPSGIPYYDGDAIYRRRYREDQNKLQFDLAENVLNLSDDEFIQPSDEDSQGNIISINKIDLNTEEEKVNAKPPNEEEENLAPISKGKQKRKEKHDTMMD